ncbi:MAG: hypothetical protein KDC95_06770 [Planctomycetes bacterium]|nr:hypothetical protein [Planctomycetota bacterium]
MTSTRSQFVFAGLAALIPTTPVTSQVFWKETLPARTSGTTLWATLHNNRIVAFDRSPSGDRIVSIDKWGRSKSHDITDPRLSKGSGIAGSGSNGDLCILLHYEDGVEETTEWDGTNWRFYDRRGPYPWQTVVGGHLLSLWATDPIRFVADSTTGRIEVEDFTSHRWSRRSLTGGPRYTTFVSAAYMSDREIIVFDGLRGETWFLDVIAQTWSKYAGTSPSPREGAAIAFDEARGRVVLHGGRTRVGNTYQTLNETWEWEGRWIGRFTNATSVDQRYGHWMFYEPSPSLGVARGLIVGGAVASGSHASPTITPRDDVRDYGPTAPAWTNESWGSPCDANEHLVADRPWLGRVITVSLERAGPITLLLAGASETAWGPFKLPIQLPNTQCLLRVSPDWISPFAGGRWSYTVPVDPRLIGHEYFHQAIDPSNLRTWRPLVMHIGEL